MYIHNGNTYNYNFMTGTRVDSLPRIAFRWFAPLPTAKSPMAFLLYTALICENHVREVVILEL